MEPDEFETDDDGDQRAVANAQGAFAAVRTDPIDESTVPDAFAAFYVGAADQVLRLETIAGDTQVTVVESSGTATGSVGTATNGVTFADK